MQNLNDWNVEGAFSRNYTMFGLLVVVLFCLIWLTDIYDAAILIFLLLVIFFFSEHFFTHKIGNILNDPEYDFPFTKTTTLLKCAFYTFLSTLSLLSFLGYFNLTIQSFSPISLVSSYIRSLLISLSIFFVLLALKSFLIGLRLVSPLDIKRGLFAMFHRISVFIRALLVTPIWLNFFSDSQNAKLIPIIKSQDFNICKMYLIAKAVFFAELIWDFDVVRYTFYLSYQKLFMKFINGNCKECGICKKVSNYQIDLKCGHSFCPECIEAEFKVRPFCPVCDKSPIDEPKIAFYDGTVSLSSIFCCF